MTTANRLNLTPDELLTTTRAVRRRLDLNLPVARAVVEECLRIAFQAPTGGNVQNWGWVVVDDPALRKTMSELYRAGLQETLSRFYADADNPPGEREWLHDAA